MKSQSASSSIDSTLVARNVRSTRLHQGLSQTELAHRSGVDLASVYRVERGKRVHSRTLRKIATGLNIIFEDLLLEKARDSSAHPVGIHRAHLAKWFPSEDQRQRLPSNHALEYQDESERQRLGQLGFVPFFMCPPLIIPPRGPGLVLVELFSTLDEPFNAEFYEDGALYVLKGGVTGTIQGETFELAEGDWVAFRTADLRSFGPAPSCRSARVLWVGATRVKRHSSTKKRQPSNSN